MNTAILIGPKRGSSTVLTEEEYQAVSNVVRLHRMGDKEANALCYALADATEERIARHADGKPLSCILDALLEQLGEHADEIQALIVERGGNRIRLLEKEGGRQFEPVRALLTILRAEGWFAEYLQFWLLQFAKKPPMPLEVMDSLSEPACNFEYDINDTKAMVKKWPELFTQPTAHRAKSDLSQLAGAVS